MTTVGAICVRDVVVANAETTVREAAELMRRDHVGSIVVTGQGQTGLPVPIGIVTDRDIVVELVAVGLDPETITVGDIMPHELVTIAADEDAAEAMRHMRMKGVRRLPVVTHEGRLLGLVAFDDLLELINEELSDLTRAAGREQARETAQRR